MAKMVMIVGFPAAGKSTVAQTYIDQGYVHINRDKAGGRVIDLLPAVKAALKVGKNVVLDNTFPTAESRAPFLQVANALGASALCALMGSTIEDAQFNACRRMVERFDKLPTPQEIKADKSPNIFPPAVLFNYRKQFEKPVMAEGFEKISTVPFVRTYPSQWVGKAVILDYDGTLRETISGAKWPVDPSDVKILSNRAAVLRKWSKNGYLLLGVSNQSGIAKGSPTHEQATACFDATNKLLGVSIEYAYCPHNPAPINCYCRKPMPGLAVMFFHKYKLDPRQCIMVGDQTSDKTFAARSGMKFVWAADFFD